MDKDSEKELVGVKEIARRAKVSIATVDRVLHNRSGVSEKTKAKIQAIIEELDYKPNILARRLASKKVLNLAILIPAVSQETDYWNAPLTGIIQAEEEIASYGVKVNKYFFDQNDKGSFVQQANFIVDSNCDGVLLAPMFIEESKYFIQNCISKGIPYVFINSDVPEQNSLCYIGPNLYASGYLAAHLSGFLVADTDQILIVNISKEIDNHHHLLRKEEGFREYFSVNNRSNDIFKIDIRQTAYESVKASMQKALENKNIKLIFVSNSRVSSVARFLEESHITGLKVIGFDFLKENIDFLKKGTIDFLICQKPIEQGYKGIMTLYNYLVLSLEAEKVYYMPIDIITKENYLYYRN
ncbi:LacI family DNA-binding transcriptional regulator [Pedobacter glucosidilyticus]|uniref:LacI family DNA-binding transcriptional regulator n=1 Tax=Pedobacter glucosidilyticus TaxID=1122941 RepID=UPI0004268017|nr:LacI family DNA-binding transcriptional regulator [Pedobacter glucosidilyticus]